MSAGAPGRPPAHGQIPGSETTPGPVLVVFSGLAHLWWLRLLRPGFRHCFAALPGPRGWILYDPLSNRTDLRFLSLPPGADLCGWYRRCGLVAVMVWPLSAPWQPAPWMPFTCVEAVKRVLGLRRRVFTPWQLYRVLCREFEKAEGRAAVAV